VVGSTFIGISNDQQSIYFAGEIKPDISRSFISILNSNKKTIKNVYLRSTGGNVYEAYLIAVEIEKNSLETYVEYECMSACTMMFIAGKKRLATPSAKIGFHRFYGGGENINYDEFTRIFYDYMGINPQFTDRIVNTEPKDVWYPSFEQMLYANVVTTQSLGGETNVLFSALSKDDLKKELLSMELYARVNAFEPEAFDDILNNSIELGKRGVLDKDVFFYIRSEISKITLKKLLYAPDNLILKNSDVFHEQIKQARNISFDACVKVLDGDLNIGQTLPAELVERTIDMQTEALKTKPVKISLSDEQAGIIFRKIIENSGLTEDELAYMNGEVDPVSTVTRCSAEFKSSAYLQTLPIPERVLIGRYTIKTLLDQL
jgi:hypothetical protein